MNDRGGGGMLYPYRMMPVFKDYIWGGRGLEKMGKALPPGRVAESWEFSCIPDNESVIGNGYLKGMSICDVASRDMKNILGARQAGLGHPFSLLLKFIDANKDLSIQVHPDDAYAGEHENGKLGKSEMWYVLAAKPGASIIHGFREDLSEHEIREALSQNRHEGLYRQLPVTAGDVVYIPAGTIHALTQGIIVAEIQENSDLTYRVYDYDRLDDKGGKRPLHLSKALDVLDFAPGRGKYPGLFLAGKESEIRYLAACRHFCVQLLCSDGGKMSAGTDGTYSLVMVLGGRATIHYKDGSETFAAMETAFLPASMGVYEIEGNFRLLHVFMPDIMHDVFDPLRQAGYSDQKITSSIAGLEGTLPEFSI